MEVMIFYVCPFCRRYVSKVLYIRGKKRNLDIKLVLEMINKSKVICNLCKKQRRTLSLTLKHIKPLFGDIDKVVNKYELL